MKIADFALASLVRELTPSPSPGDRTRTVTPMLQAWFLQFADFAAFHHLAIHCGLCRGDVANAKRPFLHWGECGGYKPPLGDTAGKVIVQTPRGMLWLGGRLEREELRPAQIEWLRQASDVLPHFQLGLHCQRCEGDITGKNADADGVYSVACRCTEFIGLNRDTPAPATVN